MCLIKKPITKNSISQSLKTFHKSMLTTAVPQDCKRRFKAMKTCKGVHTNLISKNPLEVKKKKAENI